ncbi:MAG: biopolymer transporter ExbD [Pseudomonadota bacterium]
MITEGTLGLESTARRNRISLTPMVDIVFLLLVFFMLAARFETERAIPLAPSTGGPGGETTQEEFYEGAPRLISIAPDRVRLNGFVMEEDALITELKRLMPEPDAIVVLRPVEGVSLQRTVAILDLLSAAGIGRVVLAE